MDPTQVIAQINSLYTDVGANLWALFGDLFIVVTGLMTASFLVLGIRKIKAIFALFETRYALSNLEMEDQELNQNDPLGSIEMESDSSWSDRREQKLYSHY